MLAKGDIPTWVLIMMLATGILGLYFTARDLKGRLTK